MTCNTFASRQPKPCCVISTTGQYYNIQSNTEQMRKVIDTSSSCTMSNERVTFTVKGRSICTSAVWCCLLLLILLLDVEGFAPATLLQKQETRNMDSSLFYVSTKPSFGEADRNIASTAINTTNDTDTALTTSPYLATKTATTPPAPTTKPPTVQRRFQTFPWTYNGEVFDINYRVEGPVNGPPVLLLHGFGANLNHYRHQFPVLAETGYRVYAIDLLGFGASPKPGHVHYSMELYVQLATDFIKSQIPNKSRRPFQKLPQPSWIVAGNSIGGLISLGVAQQMPDRVRGVILFNCSGGMTGFRYSDVPVWVRPILWFFQKILLGPRVGSSFFSRFKTRGNIESILRQQGVYRNQTNIDDELLEILLQPAEDEGAETVFLKTFAGDPGPTPEEILPQVECPVLAVWGGDDPWTPADGGMHPATKFHQYCHHGFELHTIPNCGHCPHDEAPDAVNAIILPWMKQLDSQ
jgi:pimeloyl-ACP methyl ester carboxylesterase